MEVPYSPLDLEVGLADLFKSAYTTNCRLEEEELTQEEKETLEDLDPLEVLANFKDLVEDLLAFKRDFKASDKSELAKRTEQFEAMLQKLESEVRNHIRVEQQLKLHLEAAQSRVEELEKKSDSTKLLKELSAKEKELEDLRSRGPVKDLELKLRHLEEKYKEEIVRLTAQYKQTGHHRVLSLEREADKKHARKSSEGKAGEERKQRTLQKAEVECQRLRLALEEKNKELEGLRKDYDRLAKELQRVDKATRLSTPDKPPLSDRENHPRRTTGEIDTLFHKRPEGSPYKGQQDRYEPFAKAKMDIYQTFAASEAKATQKKHSRTGSDRPWRPASSSIRSRPASSLKD